jgi:acyl-CoA thioester hydrolase
VRVTTIFDNKAPRAKVKIQYEVHRDNDNVLLLTGHVTLCFVNSASGRPTRAPQQLIDAFDN